MMGELFSYGVRLLENDPVFIGVGVLYTGVLVFEN